MVYFAFVLAISVFYIKQKSNMGQFRVSNLLNQNTGRECMLTTYNSNILFRNDNCTNKTSIFTQLKDSGQ